MKYVCSIVTVYSKIKAEQKVEEMLNKGWELKGVSHRINPSSFTCYDEYKLYFVIKA